MLLRAANGSAAILGFNQKLPHLLAFSMLHHEVYMGQCRYRFAMHFQLDVKISQKYRAGFQTKPP
jgi:hypothetical protein